MRIRYWCSDVFSSELAVCGSPLRNSVAASSSSALAKAGSRPARSLTVSLKSRVIVMSSPFRRCLARLVFALEQSRSLDGRLLTPLGPARKQDDPLLAVLHQIEQVARSPIYPVFAKSAADPFDVRHIAASESQHPFRHFRCHLGIV